MHRRTIVALAILAILATSVVAIAQGPREPIKIGVLNAITGPLAVNGTEINEGIKLYWEDEMGHQVANRPVRLIVEDEEGKPDVGLTKAKKLVESDKVHVILGPVHLSHDRRGLNDHGLERDPAEPLGEVEGLHAGDR